MDYAQDGSTYESVPGFVVPTFPCHKDQNASGMVLQSTVQPRTVARNVDLSQIVGFGPNPNVTQQTPTPVQDPMTNCTSIPQQALMSIENSQGINQQSVQSKMYAVKQTNWSLEPKGDDWELHKPKITELYLENNLEEVMKFMRREHGFKASTKMYKDRICKWKIGKKIKGDEMKAIIRKQTQRLRAGKKSEFRIRNSQVAESKIVRYRKTMGLSSEEQALKLRAVTPPELICYTPLASPLITPRVLETPERIAKLVEQYINGSLDSKTWLVTEDQDCVSTKDSGSPIFALQEKFIYALQLFKRYETKNAGRVLNIGMSFIEQVVAAESPITLDTLATIVLQSLLFDLPGIALTLLKHFSAMSAVTKGQGHPFNQIFARLIELDTSHLKHTLNIVQQSQMDCLAPRLGRFNWITIQLQLSVLSSTIKMNDAQLIEDCSTLLQELEDALGTSDIRCLHVRLTLARHYTLQGKSEEASEAAQNVIALAVQNQRRGIDFISEGFYILSFTYFKLSETDLAEQSIRHAIFIQVVGFGWENDYVFRYMSDLESWLEQWDRPDEAAEVRRQREEILDSKHKRIFKEEEERYRRCLASKV